MSIACEVSLLIRGIWILIVILILRGVFMSNATEFNVPYPIGTYLVKKDNCREHIDQVYEYIKDENGLSVVLLLDVHTSPRLSTRIKMADLLKKWREPDNLLLELYDNALEQFRETGYHPHPANLLSLLLLAERDRFEPLKVCEGAFYEKYKSIIDCNIGKVINDFGISNDEIVAFIEMAGILTEDDDFEDDKLWFVFSNGFSVMHGEMMYRPEQTPYEMHSCMDNKNNLYKMTEDGLKEIHQGEKPKVKVLGA